MNLSLNLNLNKPKVKSKKPRPLKNSNLYDIDNFIVSNYCSSKKITEDKNTNSNIIIPNYKELDSKYYQYISSSTSKSNGCNKQHQRSVSVSEVSFIILKL